MRLLHVLWICLVVVTGMAQSSLPAELDTNIQQRVASGVCPSVAIGIVNENGMRYFNYGQTRNGGKAVDEHTIYEIGSVSKVFTGIILADMALKGLVVIDSPAQNYLPADVRLPTRNGERITLGQLSDHTSALPRMPDNFDPADPMNPYADYTEAQMYDFVSSYELTRDIGSEYEYSNLAQGLLGHILADLADTDYETLMQLKIATPLGMEESAVELSAKMKRHLAIGHARGIEVPNWDIPLLAGAGGIRSSTHDMLRFVAANLGIIESPLYPAMELSHKMRHDKNGGGVGLAWQLSPGSLGQIISHGGRTGGYTSFIGFVKETGTGVVVLCNSDADIHDIGLYILDPDTKLDEVRPRIAMLIRQTIDTEGAAGLEKKFMKWKKDHASTYDFGEMDINSLGYYYLGVKKVEEALAVFKINTIEYPASANVWDSYGEALMVSGDTAAAIENYERSLSLNPGNENAVKMLATMGVDASDPDVNVAEQVLVSYVGKYQLAPQFIIEITLDGDQLIGQATGQPPFELYPSSETTFYLKVVEAQVKFNKNDQGEVGSLTLFQNGQEIEGVRME